MTEMHYISTIYTQATSKFLFQEAWAINAQGVFFINGYSLNELHNDEHYLFRRPIIAGLETLYTALLILTIE